METSQGASRRGKQNKISSLADKISNALPTNQKLSRPQQYLPLKLASNALGHKRNISPRIAILRRHLRQLIASTEHARAPARPTKVDVRVIVQHIQLLTHGLQTARIVRPTARLGQNRLALVLTQPVAERREGVDVVGRAGRVRAGIVRVEVLVHVEDQVRRAAVEVRHFDQRAAGAVGDERPGRGEVCAWEEDFVAGRAGLSDCCYGCLDGGRPVVDVEVVLWGNC